MDEVVSRSSEGRREYWLSVRLSRREVSKYARILEYYGLGEEWFQGSRSERFRALLDKFCDGLEVYDIPEWMLKPLVTRPPKWRRE